MFVYLQTKLASISKFVEARPFLSAALGIVVLYALAFISLALSSVYHGM